MRERRIPSPDRPPQRRVQRVDGAIALGGGDDALAADVHLEGGLGGGAVASGVRIAIVGDHPERLHLEPRLFPPAGSPHEQLERRVGHLEVVPLVLHPLQRVDEIVELGPVEREAELAPSW